MQAGLYPCTDRLILFEGGDTVKVKTLIASVALVALGTTAAGAADLGAVPVKAPPPPLPMFSWTGFYVGANIGAAWANNDWTDTFFQTNFANGNNGGVFIGGGQIGGNYQIGNFVIGGEWDFDWAANTSSNNVNGVVIPGVGTFVVTNNNRWITTVAARFGYAINRFLVYGKAGGGWISNNNLTVTDVTRGLSLTCANFTNCGNNNNGGWLVGIGGEYAFTNNWTVKLEYDYLGLGNRTLVVPATAPFILAGDTFTSSNNRNVQMVKVGANYLFNWGAPVAGGY